MKVVQDRTGSGAVGGLDTPPPGRGAIAKLTKTWFALDALLCLFPPLYWWADGRTQLILGVPAALLYFIAVSACTVASIVFAFLGERYDGEFAA